MASMAQRWRSSMPSSSSSVLAFEAAKTERTEIEMGWLHLEYWASCKAQMHTNLFSFSCNAMELQLHDLHVMFSDIFTKPPADTCCKTSRGGHLPGLEGNDVEGTLGRGTLSDPSISSRLWSNSSWTRSSSSARRSSWQRNGGVRVIKHTEGHHKNSYVKLIGIPVVPSSKFCHLTYKAVGCPQEKSFYWMELYTAPGLGRDSEVREMWRS